MLGLGTGGAWSGDAAGWVRGGGEGAGGGGGTTCGEGVLKLFSTSVPMTQENSADRRSLLTGKSF